jgi:hypothetical protein
MSHLSILIRRTVLGLATLLLLAPALPAQESPEEVPMAYPHIGLPQDWSTQRVIYTRNGSVEDMMRVRSDPRFLNSFLLHNMRETSTQNGTAQIDSAETSQAMTDGGDLLPLRSGRLTVPLRPRTTNTKIDWAVSLGPLFGMAIGESPAKYSFNPSAAPTCTVGAVVGDYIVLSLKAAPKVGSQANLVGITNLYSGSNPTGYCGSTPTFLFSYAIGTGGSLLSPVISLDGKKIAWIENSSANRAILHVTTWAANQGTNATTGAVAIGSCPTVGSCDFAIDYTNSAYTGCTASPNINTNSEIYVDYGSDSAYLGADNGILYHIKTIFTGAPTFDYCIPVNASAGTALSGAVYDPLMSPAEVFIADSKKLYAFTFNAGFTLKATYTYGAGTLTGPGPVLDAFNNFIYAFSAKDVATPTPHTSVTQVPTSLAAGSGVAVPLGPASTNAYPILFYGAFDNNYFTFGPKNAKSTLYSCGTDATTTTAQDLFAVNFNTTTGIVNTTPVMSADKNVDPGSLNGTCSPITEFYDGTTDRIFVGMGQHSATTGANVVQMWNVTTQLNNPADTFAAQATGYLGGASGLVVDNAANTGTYPQAASVYFSTLATSASSTICGANNYCAVKLTQSALK